MSQSLWIAIFYILQQKVTIVEQEFGNRELWEYD